MSIRLLRCFAISSSFAIALLSIVLISSKNIQARVNKSTIAVSDNSYIGGVNPLMSAVSNNDKDGVSFFISSDSSLVNQKNLGGATSLHVACRNGNLDIAKILVDNGANLNAADNEGWTPLMRASVSGNPALIGFLLDKGANASRYNTFNETALIHIAHANCFECLNIMLNKYDFTTSVDNLYLQDQIKDSYVVARNKNNKEMQKLLADYLVKIGGKRIVELNVDLDSAKKTVNKEGLAISGDLSIPESNVLNNDKKKSGGAYKFVGKKVDSDNKKTKASSNSVAKKGDGSKTIVKYNKPKTASVEVDEVVNVNQSQAKKYNFTGSKANSRNLKETNKVASPVLKNVTQPSSVNTPGQ